MQRMVTLSAVRSLMHSATKGSIEPKAAVEPNILNDREWLGIAVRCILNQRLFMALSGNKFGTTIPSVSDP